ncbi:hypothetical protein [Mycobacterium sp. E2479]|uniref:hypothetical protein n=1 Tax=Mycobacterium sp. E2479 TaxID=1834134 RepID=UPI0007FC1E74|nr:hypothetical protein [Mycobacterium sp. E2479]OBH49228.1 hypothetical protein A5686_16005 [Mycobacterium sp. E2479]
MASDCRDTPGGALSTRTPALGDIVNHPDVAVSKLTGLACPDQDGLEYAQLWEEFVAPAGGGHNWSPTPAAKFTALPAGG